MIRTLKPCRFAGKNYSAGEVVPDSAVEKNSIGALVRMKLIALEEEPPLIEEKPKAKRQAK